MSDTVVKDNSNPNSFYLSVDLTPSSSSSSPTASGTLDTNYLSLMAQELKVIDLLERILKEV